MKKTLTQAALASKAIKQELKKAEKVNLDKIYTPQSYLDERKVAEKMITKDYKIKYTLIDDDGEMVKILVDGNHALEAAKRNNELKKIEAIEVTNNSERTVERYVTAFGDLDNPESIITRTYLW